ncbi:MAG TPA: DUF192 domain-containing protein [Acidimicrobiales bacterium]|nr:DUF192 domain-containing protein [Acidimicrobiales bacterium]
MTEPDETDRQRLTWLRRLVWVVLSAGVLGFLVEGADNPEDPFLVPDDTTPAEAAAFPGAGGGPPVPTSSPATTAGPTTSAAPAPSGGGRSAAPGPAAPTTGAPAPAAPEGPAPTSAPTTAAPPPTTAARRPLAGFDEVAFRVTSGSGVAEGVALLADDPASRGQGLMEQRDLRGYDGMIFRFDAPGTGRFFMRNTRIPLSIAFFDAEGRFVSATDMEPCPDDVDDCPRYSADAPYLHAIEVLQGDLPTLGIGPGSILSFP